MTWITPLEVLISVMITWASLTMTLLPSTLIGRMPLNGVGAGSA